MLLFVNVKQIEFGVFDWKELALDLGKKVTPLYCERGLSKKVDSK